MDGTDAFEERLAAVERTLTDGDRSLATVEDAAGLTSRLEAVESRLDSVERRLDDIDAAVLALRGYAGELQHVNEDVERTAAAAIAAVDRLDAASGAPPAIARADVEERVPEPSAEPEASDDPDDPTVLERVRALL